MFDSVSKILPVDDILTPFYLEHLKVCILIDLMKGVKNFEIYSFAIWFNGIKEKTLSLHFLSFQAFQDGPQLRWTRHCVL